MRRSTCSKAAAQRFRASVKAGLAPFGRELFGQQGWYEVFMRQCVLTVLDIRTSAVTLLDLPDLILWPSDVGMHTLEQTETGRSC